MNLLQPRQAELHAPALSIHRGFQFRYQRNNLYELITLGWPANIDRKKEGGIELPPSLPPFLKDTHKRGPFHWANFILLVYLVY